MVSVQDDYFRWGSGGRICWLDHVQNEQADEILASFIESLLL